jgi:membrane protein
MIMKRIVTRFINERFFDQAAQTAYYLLLSMIPFFIFILSLLSLFPVNEEMLLNYLRPFVPVESFRLIEKNIHAVVGKSQGNLFYLSLIIAFWVSSVTVQSLARSLDLAYGRVRRLAFWKAILRDLGVTLLFMIVIPLSLFLPILVKLLQKLIAYSGTVEDWQGWLYLWPNIKWGMGTIFLFAFFLLFYKVVPTGKVKLKEAMPGAIFSTLGWQFFSL